MKMVREFGAIRAKRRRGLTAEGPRDVGNVLGETEIGNLDVAVGSEEDVFRFEIPVNDIERVKVVECERDFCREEFCNRIREPLSSGIFV